MILNVAGAYICEGDRFLICKRPENKSNGGLWEFPGGKLEPGESAAQAIIRECREELAIDLSAYDVPIAETIRENNGITIRLMLMKCSVIGGHLRLLEHSDAQWILAAEYPGFDFCPADRELLKMLFPDIMQNL